MLNKNCSTVDRNQLQFAYWVRVELIRAGVLWKQQSKISCCIISPNVHDLCIIPNTEKFQLKNSYCTSGMGKWSTVVDHIVRKTIKKMDIFILGRSNSKNKNHLAASHKLNIICNKSLQIGPPKLKFLLVFPQNFFHLIRSR
jgi:hypothetical protein